MDVESLWRGWYLEGDGCARENLILHYYPLVAKVASKMHRTLPAQVSLEDVSSFGTLGLIRAVEHYHPWLCGCGHTYHPPGEGRKRKDGKPSLRVMCKTCNCRSNRPGSRTSTSFETYAVQSIRGLILDELRSSDWAPRSLRKRQKEIDKVQNELEILYGREAQDLEIAQVLTGRHGCLVTATEVMTTRKETVESYAKSLDEQRVSGEETAARHEFVVAADDLAPLDEHVWSAVTSEVLDEMMLLGPLPLLVLTLYYYEKLSFGEISEKIGLAESRVAAIHAESVRRLKERAAGVVAVL